MSGFRKGYIPVALFLIAGLIHSLAMAGAKEPSIEVLTKRAELFRDLGLIPIAREQYQYILKKDPKNKEGKEAIADLTLYEGEYHFRNAELAMDVGALDLAILELDRVLVVNPKHKKGKMLRKKLGKEKKMREGMKDLVSHDYFNGISHYQGGQYNRALEYFVKVINVFPSHKGAQTYIEKIGKKMEVDR